MADRMPPALTALEVRVLGVLVEKERTVPDTYPLSLNALAAGCNQKTSRDPVMSAGEGEVQAAIDSLRRASLVIESSGGRVMRYAHNVKRVLELPSEAVALLATLALRGPQTVSELRLNCERLHRFADASSVEAFLDELAARPAGALVVQLPRQPGTREARWMQLLGGAGPAQLQPQQPQSPQPLSQPQPASEMRADVSAVSPADGIAALTDTVARLERELAELRGTVARLCDELGVSPDAPQR
ncbi:MAG: YceH family protein [Burkholderiaceae bacterium]